MPYQIEFFKGPLEKALLALGRGEAPLKRNSRKKAVNGII